MSDISRAVQIEELDQAFVDMARYFISHWLLEEDEMISPKQFILLRVLYDKEKSTVSDLATMLRQSNSATTIALNRLVKAGYVNRVRDEQDRRVVWVTVSDKAIPLIERLLCKRRDLMTRLLKSLTDEEVVQFTTYLRKMKQGLQE
ncbi:MarR family winged helix-turn-helix transcriptional regulator [Brevibacillus composti]|uniref:MarR family transcriptional regulator n=1 Tax=Brevibacillus composti TaxID=2796470 RepID=A0A7T5JQ28_9BACL|nr:MarR family transcriptional regulator [Brevibacillus composti]QQE76048.1 MarR family transcriptional regulator [Brevibacillus composti]